MIIEGVITTTNPDRSTNVAPLGPVVDESLESFLLRPYQTSTTFRNLVANRCGIFHITDDVELIALAAIDQLPQPLPLRSAVAVSGKVLTGACRWIELEVTSIDASQPRSEITCRIVHRGRLRDFFGFCRAKHAVIEAAILATRIDFLPHATIQSELQRLATIVKKTAGDAEHRAFADLVRFITPRLSLRRSDDSPLTSHAP